VESNTVSVALSTTNAPLITTGAAPPPALWRDPHTVPPEDLAASIQRLERACLAEPQSVALRTCLGMAYAMNYQVDESMDALELAVSIDPDNFWAQLKYAELHYRLRVLNRAEDETVKALNLATDPWQLSLARKQLQEVRTLKHSCVRNVEWTKPLTGPLLVLSAMFLEMIVVMTFI
jgi:tetratricopeptide (TPR) repeat protein